MTKVKRTYALLALVFAFTVAIVTIVPYTDQAVAYTVIKHGDDAVGGCGGAGC
jgi:hypothetical protein